MIKKSCEHTDDELGFCYLVFREKLAIRKLKPFRKFYKPLFLTTLSFKY